MATKKIGTATVKDGVASAKYTIGSEDSVGDFKLIGNYLENDTYRSASAEASYKIRIGTVITCLNAIGTAGEKTTFTANVKYNSTLNVNEGQVQFVLNGANIGETVTVTGGVATLSYTIPDSTPDDSVITAKYLGTGTYAASVTSKSAVLSMRKTPTILMQNATANRGDSLAIKGTITDSDGNNITTGEAQLYIDNVATGDVVTVKDGSIDCVWKVPTTAATGSHTAKIVYAQNDTYNSVEATAQINIRTKVSLTNANISGNIGGTVTLTTTVTDEYSHPVQEGQVKITCNDTSTTVTVTAEGVATTEFTIPASAKEGTTYSYSAEYIQNTNYESGKSTADGIVTIRTSVVITLDNIEATIGDTIILGATVKTNESVPTNVDEGTIEFIVDDS